MAKTAIQGGAFLAGAGILVLTKAELSILLEEEVDKSLAAAKKLHPRLADHPKPIQAIVVDMIYNLGEGGFAKWSNTRSALDRKDYAAFADGLKNSKWYAQVGRRSAHHVATAQAVASNSTLPATQPT